MQPINLCFLPSLYVPLALFFWRILEKVLARLFAPWRFEEMIQHVDLQAYFGKGICSFLRPTYSDLFLQIYFRIQNQ